MKNAIVLCSGGLDSVTTAYYVKKKLKYDKLIVLFFHYGQKSFEREKAFSMKCAKKLEAKFIEIKLKELDKISTSLINKSGRINKVGRKDLKDTREEGKNWYVPFRNAIFLIYALSFAESVYIKTKRRSDIFIGFKHEGISGFPDTSKNFLKVIRKLSFFSEAGNYKIEAPLMAKDKSDLILLGEKLGVSFKNTFSCYIRKGKHCGYCLACRLRQEGFYWADIKDPTEYKIKMKDFRVAD